MYYSTFCPIRHFVIRRFVPFDFFAFDILSHSMLFLFDNLSHSTFCPIRHFLRSIFCPFDVLSNLTFCLFDILSHSTFWHSALCPIRRFVVRRFVHSAFVTSTFCRWTGCPPVRLIVFAATPIPRGCPSMKLSLNEADTLRGWPPFEAHPSLRLTPGCADGGGGVSIRPIIKLMK
jgi:hypothetical protein